jgi:xanthine/uracil permease
MSTVDEQIRQHRAHENDPTVVDLIKQLRDEGTTLFRQEILLAKQEMTEKVSHVGRNVGYVVAGGLVAYAGVVIVLAALSVLLYGGLVAAGVSHMVSGWLAPLIVGGVVALIGFGLVKKAQHALSEETLVPERTKQSLQEDKQWIQNKV